MNDMDTREREIRGLVEACKTHELTQGLIVTYREENTFAYEGIQVRCVPLIDFLLQI
jgi:hypothetical protein